MCVLMFVNLSSGSRERVFKSALQPYHAIKNNAKNSLKIYFLKISRN